MTTPQPDADGWIAHDGGEDMPVDGADIVEAVNESSNTYAIGNAERFDWAVVSRYRILTPKHELDKALARIAALEDVKARLIAEFKDLIGSNAEAPE